MNGSHNFKNDLEPWRVYIYAGLLALVLGVFIFRLFSLQILQRSDWVAKAAENSILEQNIQALRGIIYDRNGSILASNQAAYNLVVTGANLPDDPGATQRIFREVSKYIGLPVNLGVIDENTPFVPCVSQHGIAQIADFALTSYPYTPIKILCDIDERQAKVLIEKSVDWPGITVEIEPVRNYPTNSVTASVVGFLGPIPEGQSDYYEAQGLIPNRDKVGYAGVELEYQDLLAGRNGLRVAEKDVGGQVVRPDILPPTLPQPGYSLRLTIDTRLQQAATEIVKQSLDFWNSKVLEHKQQSVSVVIAMNPQTGEILSMVSYPSYENQRMARIIPAYYYEQLFNDPANPLLNYAVGGRLPVGSVFKIVTGTGALNEGVVTPDQIIETPGKLVISEKYYTNDPGRNRDLVDWIYKDNPGGFGQLDFLGGLSNSSNVYFYKLGGGYKEEIPNGGLGICRLKEYAEAMSYGEIPPGIGLVGLPDEQGGLIPDPKWKRVNQAESWSSGDTYIASVGQGSVLGTPLQVLLSASIVANNGKYIKPTLIREVFDAEGNVVPVWRNPDGTFSSVQSDGAVQISPFQPYLNYDLTIDPVIQEYGETTIRGCEPVEGKYKTVQPWVFEKVREGMRMAVTDGTLKDIFEGTTLPAAGKTGTAEYCDKWVAAKNLCIPGSWPTHAWTVGFAPYENPEIAVVAFVYNGGEGASVAGPLVRQVLEYYFELKALDAAAQAP